MRLPTINNYGKYASDNYGVNTLSVELETLTVYYSYKTIVAYRDREDGLIVSQNMWSVTTGKHLNWIEPKHSKRKDSITFDLMLERALKRHIK